MLLLSRLTQMIKQLSKPKRPARIKPIACMDVYIIISFIFILFNFFI